MTDVIDPNEKSASSSSRLGRDEIKGGIDINWLARGQLRDLFIALTLEMISHLHQDFGKAQVVFTAMLVGIADLQESGGAGASGATGRIWKLKGGQVGDIRRRLVIFATRNHHDSAWQDIARCSLLLEAFLESVQNESHGG
jgi:hypothetical protein